MNERQQYYRELIEYIIKKHYDVDIDITKTSEVPLPNVRMDMVVEIPKANLEKGTCSAFPYWAEMNIVHIKAVNDKLTKMDVVQYLGELYILATSSKAKDKSIVLVIVSAEKVQESIFKDLRSKVKETAYPWIQEIVGEAPAYLFILENLPPSQEHRYFLPFQPLSAIAQAKNFMQEIVKHPEVTKEELLFLFWLRRLQPKFYQEVIQMPRDIVAVIDELFPQIRTEGRAEGEEAGIKKGALQGKIEAILDIKFSEEGLALMPQVREISDIAKLTKLQGEVKKAKSLDEIRLAIASL
jgi:hypothetical protein